MSQTDQLLHPSRRSLRKNRLNYSASFKGPKNLPNELGFSRNNELRHSTGSMKGKSMVPANQKHRASTTGDSNENSEVLTGEGPSVPNLIKGFQAKIVNGNTKYVKSSSLDSYSSYTDFNSKTAGVVEESQNTERKSAIRKLSMRHKKNKMTADDARYGILQSLGMSPFGNENRTCAKSFGHFDVQSLFFSLQRAATFNEEGTSYTKKLTGASAASVRNNPGRKNHKNGEFDPVVGRFRSRAESMIDEGDKNCNHLVLNCPYFRNEIAEERAQENSVERFRSTKDVTKLISMFNRNRSFENLRSSSLEIDRISSRRRAMTCSENDILLEEVKDGSNFFAWDEPNVSERQIFDFEHIDRGALYYREFFHSKEHSNLFGIDKKYGPVAISIIREVLTRMAVLGHEQGKDKNAKNKYQYRIILRTSELETLRITVLENSIPSNSRHNSSRAIPLKDVLEYCFPDLQLACLRHAIPGPKIGEQLLKLDEQQLSLTYKIGLLYCKAGQTTEEEMYNNEHAGLGFVEFCSVIADKVALKGFQGYRAQLDNKSDSTGAYSLYTCFHGREIMFHVSTELPYTANNKQQVLRKRHIGNDIVTLIFQEHGSEPFTPQSIRSHFQHVFIIVRPDHSQSNHTCYEVAMTRSMDVPCYGPPIPPNKFEKGSAFREFLLSKLINAENAAHKSDKFSHMVRRTRSEYLRDLATTGVSAQTIEPNNKFGFSFTTKKKEKNHPPVSPEIWIQGGLVWSVNFDYDYDGTGAHCILSISTKAVVIAERTTQDILLSIPCKSVLGWRSKTHTLKLFYEDGKMAFVTLCEGDINELLYVVNRLKAVTPGCETQDLILRRNNDGQLGFHVFYEGLVAQVEPYALAWQAGLRKGSRLLEISGCVVKNMSHERMIQMLKRPGAVRIVVLPPTPEGQPRNYKALKNMRRYSSMTSVYSMSMIADDGSTSSKEYLTATSTESPVTPAKNTINAQLNKTSTLPTETNVSSVTERSPLATVNHPLRIALTPARSSQSSIIASRSATDISLAVLNSAEQRFPVKLPVKPTPPKKIIVTPHQSAPIPAPKSVPVKLPGAAKYQKVFPKITSPSNSLDQDLVDLEMKLTDTRKSIDAKFYRSLANSQSPFFRPKALFEPGESSIKENDSEPTNVAKVYARCVSEMHYPIYNERPKVSTEAVYEINPPVKTNSDVDGRCNRIENAVRNTPPDDSGFALVDLPTTTIITHHDPSIPLFEQQPVVLEINSGKGRIMNDSSSGGSVQESSAYRSMETLNSDSDSLRHGSIVKTKVRHVSEILNERNVSSDSRQLFYDEKFRSASASPKLCKRMAVKVVDEAAKQKVNTCKENIGKLDESLSETFAKIDAAFGFKPPVYAEEKKKRRRSYKRRSRNYEPPESDSSANEAECRTISRKRLSPEDVNVCKSEAEEGFEAALSEFQMSIVSMQERKNTHDGENPPAVPLRTSRPQSLVEHRLKQFNKESSKSPNKVGEMKASLTTIRPWSPPPAKPQSSKVIKEHVERKLKSLSQPNEVSPQKSGARSLPCRRKRAGSTQERARSRSVSYIPLAVRGLDLATNKGGSTTSVWSKADLHVMLTVMESELVQEREEKERLCNELNRSQEEKERLLEQSKQAVTQLQRFTSLFLDSSPEALEKARQRYADINQDL